MRQLLDTDGVLIWHIYGTDWFKQIPADHGRSGEWLFLTEGLEASGFKEIQVQTVQYKMIST